MIDHKYSKPMFIFESNRPVSEVRGYINTVAATMADMCGEVGLGAWEGTVSTAYIVETRELTPSTFAQLFAPLLEGEDAFLYVAIEHTRAGDRKAILYFADKSVPHAYAEGAINEQALGTWRDVTESQAGKLAGYTRRANGRYYAAL